MRFLLLLAMCLPAWAAASDLIRFARSHPDAAKLHDALGAAMPAADLAKGSAVIGEGGDLLFATKASGTPKLLIDEKPGPAMMQAGDIY